LPDKAGQPRYRVPVWWRRDV